MLRGGHRARPDEDRPPRGVDARDAVRHHGPLLLVGAGHVVRQSPADHGPVRRHADDREPVHGPELSRHLPRRPRHAGQAQVAAEEALITDPRQRIVPAREGRPLLGLDELMEPVLPRPVGHGAARELVDDLDRPVLDEVVLVPEDQVMRRERSPHQVLAPLPPPPHAGERSRQLLQPGLPGRGQLDGPLALLEHEVPVPLEALGERQGRLVNLLLAPLAAAAGDDQGRAGLVHQDAVGLVHDGEEEAAVQELARPAASAVEPLELELDPVRLVAQDDPVLEIVEGDLLVRAVGHVRGVRGAPRLGIHPVDDHSHREPERLVHGPHPLGVPPGQVVVHRDDVDGKPRQGRRRGRQRRGEGLALPGLHLGHHAGEEHPAADDLHVEVRRAEGPARGLADEREGSRDQLVAKPFPPEPGSEPGRFPADLRGVQGPDRGAVGRHRLHEPPPPARPRLDAPGHGAGHRSGGAVEPARRRLVALGVGPPGDADPDGRARH